MNKINEELPVLGLPDIDEQHSYLFLLFEALTKLRSHHDRAVAAALLEEIEHYFLFHCSTEEQLMRYYRFPYFASHQTDHEMAGRKLAQFLDDFDGNRLNCAAMQILLTGWLMEHIRTCDQEYARWIIDKRKKLWLSLGLVKTNS